MNRLTPTLVLAVAVLLLGGCPKGEEPEEPPKLTPEEAAAATRALVTWFECEECEEGELEAVTRYGEAVVPNLIGALREGASPASTELLRRQLETRYDELIAYARETETEVPEHTREQFIELQLANYEALYRVRAAQALAAIGTPAAEKALAEAAESEQRDDVRAAIRQSMAD